MTRRTNARIAGLAFLLYIALGITAVVLLHTATAGESIAERLASAAGHEGAFRLSAVLTWSGGVGSAPSGSCRLRGTLYKRMEALASIACARP